MTETVVITGASAGVGRALVRHYGQRGANVVLLARGRAGLDGARQDVEQAGGRALAIPTDVSDADEVEAAADAAEAEFGPIDTWINVAMVTVLANTWDVTPEEFRRVMEVNYLGAVHGTLAALRRMRPRDRGMIMNVGSALAFRGIPLQSPYCASKAALQNFTESLHTELLHDDSGVMVGQAHLPGLNTTQFTWGRNKLPNAPQPVPPIYQPEVAAEAIVWACDHRRRQTWVAATTPMTIWGNRLAQGLLARYLARNTFGSQQTDLPASTYPGDNLDEPLDAHEDRGSHGPFDDRAHDVSPFDLLSRNRGKVLAGAALVGAATVAAIRTGDR